MRTPFDLVTLPADPHNYGSRRGALITTVVLHTMEGTCAGAAQHFADPDAQASAHYGIAKDGRLYRFVDESYAAWHAGNGQVNRHSLGIELEGFCADARTFTEPMLSTLVWLLADLCGAYKITPDRTHLIGHCEVLDPRHPGELGGAHHHLDPGPHFPWSRIVHDVREVTGTTAPAGA